jgi:hypothetical protein
MSQYTIYLFGLLSEYRVVSWVDQDVMHRVPEEVQSRGMYQIEVASQILGVHMYPLYYHIRQMNQLLN